jgi:HK97 family phage portal protein
VNPLSSAWASIRNLFRRGDDPQRQVRYVLPYQVSGISLTPDETLSISTVWACIDVIARSISSCRWNVYEPTGKNRRKRLDDDPLAWILNTRPNPDMTAIGFREAMLFQAIPFGNSYAEIVRDGAGRVSQLWPLASDRVAVRRDEKWQLVYDHLNADGTVSRLPSRSVLHFRGRGLYGLMGENLIARAAKSIAVAAAQERFTASFFGQGAHPSGVLEYPNKLDDATYLRLKSDWAEKRKGPENAHKPIILEHGMKWTATSVEPEGAQLVEGRQFSVEEICRWFGVPPHKVQHLLRATFSNIEHTSIEFVRDALTPWSIEMNQEVDFKLLHNGGTKDRGPWRYSCIDLRPLTAGDAKSRAEAYGQLRQNGIMTANEARELEGLDDAGDDGDVLLVQSNLTTVERIIDPPAPPAPAMLPGGAPGQPGAPGQKPAPGKKKGGNDPSVKPAEGDDAETSAREGLTIMLGMVLNRYARRLANRRADLERAKRPDVDGELAREREALWPKLLAELEPAAGFARRVLGRDLTVADLQAAAKLVDLGEAPGAAAARALPPPPPQLEAGSFDS